MTDPEQMTPEEVVEMAHTALMHCAKMDPVEAINYAVATWMSLVMSYYRGDKHSILRSISETHAYLKAGIEAGRIETRVIN